ncbi:MAG TPA: hypothetical protein VFC14_12480 [Burkholderiales bacterium]|nr:hypothetical protein [Burkholderiales bacterium]
MIRSSLYAIAVIGTLAITGCRDDSPIVSAQINGSPLSDQQVQALNAWLKENSSSWTLIVAPPPGPTLSVAVKQASGKIGHFDFFSRENWQTTVVFWSEDPANNRIGQFREAEVANLRRMLESKQ